MRADGFVFILGIVDDDLVDDRNEHLTMWTVDDPYIMGSRLDDLFDCLLYTSPSPRD